MAYVPKSVLEEITELDPSTEPQQALYNQGFSYQKLESINKLDYLTHEEMIDDLTFILNAMADNYVVKGRCNFILTVLKKELKEPEDGH